ncbi:uncharacterized protein LOC128298109 [Anopheles moucheti]|uniref:uncharacterized protein LOC128298109 n=1 Tax=Anopheles moucheti TaxID=186751 RepID=UPI0022F0B65C|nr:uncharacterized protein LOC128298109 [Anopheles moucheti]XP_052889805.1 uncharacterized protein LOC128298109 [Anopheles moucheti]XP_052889806.1 uncharacterized protein LOC128298109 [Anopheles moucheti]
MSFLKCKCGCDKLSKEELKIVMTSCDRPRDFLNNPTAREMFRSEFSRDEPDRYASQPSGSKNRPVGRTPTPNAIKYLNLMEEADRLLRTNDLNDEEVEDFLCDQLYDSTSTNRAEALEAIVSEYWTRLKATEQYTQFLEKLKTAYEGKTSIRKQ